MIYEGYGPEGVAVLVEALTDNRNRTASEVRHLFAKFGGNLGTTGAVAWQFERKGVVLVSAADVDEDALVLTTAPEALSAVRSAVEDAGFSVESVELAMIPKVTVAIGDESVARSLVRLVEGLEEADDVQDVYANFDIPEALLEAVVA